MNKIVIATLIFICLCVVDADARPTTEAEVYSIVNNAVWEVNYQSPTHIVCKQTRRLTVTDPRGADAALFSTYICRGMSELLKFKGTVTNAQGKVIKKLNKSDLQQSEYSPELASDVTTYYTTFAPAVYPYTVCYEWEQRYTDGILSLPAFMPQNDDNQSVEQATYRLSFKGECPVRYDERGSAKAEIERGVTERGDSCYTFRFDRLPAVANLPYRPHLSSLTPHINFVPHRFVFNDTSGSFQSWKTYGQWLFGLQQGRQELPADCIEQVKQLTDTCRTARQKVEALYHFLGQTTRYVSIQLGIGGLQPAAAADVYRTGYGDCKALTNYMQSMLTAIGIASNYAIVHTKEPRMRREFASAAQANHVVLQVPLPGDTLWLECTNPKLPMGYAHTSLAGHDCLLVTSEGGRLCRITDYADTLHTQVTNIRVHLQPDGAATVDVSHTARLASYEVWKALSELRPDKQKKTLLKQYRLNQMECGDIRFAEDRELTACISTSYRIRTRQYGNVTGSRTFIALNPFHNEVERIKPDPARTDSIEIKNGYLHIDTVVIDLPNGTAIESYSQPIRLDYAFGSFQSEVKPTPHRITVAQRLKLRRGIYPATMYADLVHFWKGIAKYYNGTAIIRSK